MSDNSKDIPAVIPKVVFDDNGEPIIAEKVMVEESPVPKILTVFILIMVVSSVLYGYIEERTDSRETRARNVAEQELFNRLQDQSDRLQAQADTARLERDRLRELVIAIAAMGEEGNRLSELLNDFADESNTPPRSSQPPAIAPRPGESAAPEGPPPVGQGQAPEAETPSARPPVTPAVSAPSAAPAAAPVEAPPLPPGSTPIGGTVTCTDYINQNGECVSWPSLPKPSSGFPLRREVSTATVVDPLPLDAPSFTPLSRPSTSSEKTRGPKESRTSSAPGQTRRVRTTTSSTATPGSRSSATPTKPSRMEPEATRGRSASPSRSGPPTG